MEFNNKEGQPITESQIATDLQRVGINLTETINKNEQDIEQKTESEIPLEENLSNESQLEAELTGIEKEARRHGWNPKGEKSAEEFLRAKPLYNEIRERGREIKELRATVDQLKKIIERNEHVSTQRALEQLKAQKREAIKLGDADLVDTIEAQEREVLSPPQELQYQYNHAIEDFKERHAEWLSDYGYESQQMRDFVLERDRQLAALNLKPERHIEIIEKDLHRKFPEYFKGNELKFSAATASVESDMSRTTSGSKRKPTFHDLTPEQKKIARYMEKHAGMKIETYIDQLIEVGGITY